MKKIILTTIISCLSLFAFSQSITLKLGHINSQELISLLPETKQADIDLQDYAKSLETQISSMEEEYKRSIEEYQNNESSYDEITKQDKIAAIQAIEQRITNFQQNAQISLQQKQQELLDPIIEKVRQAIDQVAIDGNYTYILDTSAGSLLYYKESEDILSKVKKELGI